MEFYNNRREDDSIDNELYEFVRLVNSFVEDSYNESVCDKPYMSV